MAPLGRPPIYVQCDVPEHAELHYLLECATGYGEAARMIQFRQAVSGYDRCGFRC